METSYHKRYLAGELAKRCEKNQRYSLRSFAKSLEIDAATLSRILAGKKPLTLKTAAKIVERLPLTPSEQKKFLESAAEAYKSREIRRSGASTKELLEERVIESLPADVHKVIADWYHGAIMEMTFVENFNKDPRWISKSLGISHTEAKLAIERLLNLKMLKVVSGKLQKAAPSVFIKYKNATSSALKTYLMQTTSKSLESLENDSYDKRAMLGMTLPIDPDRIDEAKELIQEFSVEFTKHMTKGKKKKVYHLQVGFFPLQK